MKFYGPTYGQVVNVICFILKLLRLQTLFVKEVVNNIGCFDIHLASECV